MPDDVYTVDRLVIAIEGVARKSRDPDADTLRVVLSYKLLSPRNGLLALDTFPLGEAAALTVFASRKGPA